MVHQQAIIIYEILIQKIASNELANMLQNSTFSLQHSILIE